MRATFATTNRPAKAGFIAHRNDHSGKDASQRSNGNDAVFVCWLFLGVFVLHHSSQLRISVLVLLETTCRVRGR